MPSWVKQSVYSSLRLMHCCINKHNLASCLISRHSDLQFFLMTLILNCISGFGFCDTLFLLTALPGLIHSFAFSLFMECWLSVGPVLPVHVLLDLGARSQKEAIHTCLAVQRHGYHELCKIWEACTMLFFVVRWTKCLLYFFIIGFLVRGRVYMLILLVWAKWQTLPSLSYCWDLT